MLMILNISTELVSFPQDAVSANITVRKISARSKYMKWSIKNTFFQHEQFQHEQFQQLQLINLCINSQLLFKQ